MSGNSDLALDVIAGRLQVIQEILSRWERDGVDNNNSTTLTLIGINQNISDSIAEVSALRSQNIWGTQR